VRRWLFSFPPLSSFSPSAQRGLLKRTTVLILRLSGEANQLLPHLLPSPFSFPPSLRGGQRHRLRIGSPPLWQLQGKKQLLSLFFFLPPPFFSPAFCNSVTHRPPAYDPGRSPRGYTGGKCRVDFLFFPSPLHRFLCRDCQRAMQ